MSGWVDPATWYASLPSSYIAAGMLLTDPGGRVLMVKPNYRDHWGLPGGVADDGEPPHRTAEREIAEELGLARAPGALLAVDFAPAAGDRPRPLLYFLFDGGTIPASTPIALQADELDAHAFLAPGEAAARSSPEAARRLGPALDARATGRTAYVPAL